MTFRITLAVLSLGLLVAVGAFGQATGLILGTAQDGSGAVIPAADVLAINELTGIEQSAQTDAQAVQLSPHSSRDLSRGGAERRIPHILVGDIPPHC